MINNRCTTARIRFERGYCIKDILNLRGIAIDGDLIDLGV